MKNVLVVLCVVASWSSGVVRASPRDEPSNERRHDALREGLLQADVRVSADLRRSGGVEGFVPHLSDDVVYLAPGHLTAQGKEAARALLVSLYPSPTTVTVDRTLFWGDVSADGLLGYTFGYGTQAAVQPDGSTQLTPIRYVAAWKQTWQGWKMAAYLWDRAQGRPSNPPAGFPQTSGGNVRWNWPGENEEQVLHTDAAFAQLSVALGYTVAFTAYTAPNAVEVSTPMAWGYDAVLADWQGYSTAETLGWTPTRAGSSFSGDLAWSIGDVSYTYAPGGVVQVQSYSKYLDIWARQPDGRWQFILDTGNSSPPPLPAHP